MIRDSCLFLTKYQAQLFKCTQIQHLRKVRPFIYLPISRLGRSILPNLEEKEKKQVHKQKSVLCFVFGATAPSGPRPPHSRDFQITHNEAPQSVGLLWKSDQLVAKTSLPDNTQHSQQTDMRAPGGIRTHNLSRRAASDLRLRPRGHWDRPFKIRLIKYIFPIKE